MGSSVKSNDQRSVRIVVPEAPLSLNRLLELHHMELHRYKARWQRMMWGLIGVQDRAWLESLAKLGIRMKVEIEVHHPRLFDPDNLVPKAILDGLVNLKYLSGDSGKQIDLSVSQVKSLDRQTVISIREA